MRRTLAAVLAMVVFAGCASPPLRIERNAVDPLVAPADYITSLREPISAVKAGWIFDGGSVGVEVIDATGTKAHFYLDYGGVHQPEFRKAERTWRGRAFGEIVLGDLDKGRSLEIPSAEAEMLLRVLEDVHSRRGHGDDLLEEFIAKLAARIKDSASAQARGN